MPTDPPLRFVAPREYQCDESAALQTWPNDSLTLQTVLALTPDRIEAER
jgi:hypothetical protein